ncbi:hypothetical protein P5668_23645 [Bacillus subtilis]
MGVYYQCKGHIRQSCPNKGVPRRELKWRTRYFVDDFRTQPYEQRPRDAPSRVMKNNTPVLKGSERQNNRKPKKMKEEV